MQSQRDQLSWFGLRKHYLGYLLLSQHTKTIPLFKITSCLSGNVSVYKPEFRDRHHLIIYACANLSRKSTSRNWLLHVNDIWASFFLDITSIEGILGSLFDLWLLK